MSLTLCRLYERVLNQQHLTKALMRSLTRTSTAHTRIIASSHWWLTVALVFPLLHKRCVSRRLSIASCCAWPTITSTSHRSASNPAIATSRIVSPLHVYAPLPHSRSRCAQSRRQQQLDSSTVASSPSHHRRFFLRSPSLSSLSTGKPSKQ
jgi:hypothetical protein